MIRPYHSRRLPQGLTQELLADAPVPLGTLDLAESNPTRCGLQWAMPTAAVGPLYEGAAMGPRRAREAVAAYLTQGGRCTSSYQVMLTSSTSEGLSFAFKLALNPNDTVACGVPGYPLVPHIAELEGLQVSHFALREGEDRAWRIDLAEVERALQEGAAAVVVVSPGNPIGVCLDAPSLKCLAELCNQHQALAIFDEVFAAYHQEAPHLRLVDTSAFHRAICLGGLSKAALLPQAKISWLTVHGDSAFQQAALAGLEWIGDSFLSLGCGADVLPDILAAMVPVQAHLRQRIDGNVRALRALWRNSERFTVDPYTAGWYAIVRPTRAWLAQSDGASHALGSAPQEAHLAEHVLRHCKVNVLPGYLFDLPGRHTLVSSLIVPRAVHDEAWGRVAAHLSHCTPWAGSV